MGIFGWSYPPGCNSVPGDEVGGIILDENKTLKGYGKRGHGLCGKDADLNAGGQIIVHEAVWTEDGIVRCEIEGYATLSPSEEWTEEQKDSAQETVMGSGQPGEWDGGSWVCTYKTTLKYESQHENEDDVLAELHQKIWADPGLQSFRTEMIGCSEMFNQIDKEPHP